MTEADLMQNFDAAAAQFRAARQSLSTVIYGQEEVVELTLATLAAGGHGLLVGAPGLAKTLLVMIGGDVQALERARPVMETYANPIIHVGAPGDAMKM
ncbi:MAG TPA: hypothetical protein PKM48_13545, partial [Parvularculaceae bacterium]|nr:hypothetical protein [Parvularculaceae bacterium]